VDALGTDVAASVRRAAAKGLGALRLGDLEPARQTAIQARCLEALLAATADGEWVVRYAVVVGLEGLAKACPLDPAAQGALKAGLQRLQVVSAENPTVVQLRAQLALDHLSPP
jgi:phycocyanobilin lyase beta subunit